MARLLLTLLGRLVEDLVVRQRVRVRANDVRVHEGRPLAPPDVLDRAAQHLVRSNGIAPVHLFDEEVREVAHEL